MQPKLLGFRVSQHQQTRFSDITEEIEIATMFKDLTSWYCNFLSISDEIFNPFFENIGLSILYKNIGFKLFVLLSFQNPNLWPLFKDFGDNFFRFFKCFALFDFPCFKL